MKPQTISLPLEFVVLGKPISHQTQNKEALRAWKTHVHETTKNVVGVLKPSGDHIRIVISHYFLADLWETGVPDSDNIVKPIRDALNKLIYADDYQITDSVSRRRNLADAFRIKGMTPALAEGFISQQEFVHLLIEQAPDPTHL